MAVASTAAAPLESVQDARIKEKLQKLRQTDNVTNIFYFVRVYLYFALAIGGALWFFHYSASQEWSWWWNVPVAVLAITLVGAGQHQLTALAHEAVHHILFKSRMANDLLSDWLCMFPLYSATQHYRLQHLAHNQFVNDPERDPDISQLKTSGHWLNFPVQAGVFVKTLLKQLWLPNLINYMRIRAKYNAIATDKNPYLKKGWKPEKLTVRIGILYMIVLVATLAALVRLNQPLLLAVIPAAMWLGMMVFYRRLPESMYHQSRVHPVISMRTMTLMRVTFVSLIFNALAWLSLLVTSYAAFYYFLFWLVPIFTSFSFFMVLRQIVQHGNGDRGWLTNTRVFFVNPLINFAVFPIGQDYHLPHHLFASVPHFRLKELHEALLDCADYRNQAVIVEGYLFPPHIPPEHPTVVEVLGPKYHHKAAEVYIDNDVLENEEVEEKEEILQQGEEEKRKRRREMDVSPLAGRASDGI